MNFKRIILILFMIVALALIVIRLLSKFPHDLITYIGIGLIIPSLVFELIAFYQLGSSFTVTAQAKELVTKGLYARIRHPMYLFQLLLILGISMVTRDLIAYALCFLGTGYVIWRAQKENRVLEERFGDAYRTYRKQVWF